MVGAGSLVATILLMSDVSSLVAMVLLSGVGRLVAVVLLMRGVSGPVAVSGVESVAGRLGENRLADVDQLSVKNLAVNLHHAYTALWRLHCV